MARIQTRRTGNGLAYLLGGRELRNGDELLLRMRGEADWEPITIAGLPGLLRAKLEAHDGKEIQTTLPVEEVELRWPSSR
jgi:hypothetical protein